jgi:hypothetical protein
MTKRRVFLLLVGFAVAGCAFGRTQDYSLSKPTLQYASQERLVVGVQDRRPYILNRDKGEDFVGLQRGGYGNPFDVRTASGLPLAEDMAKVLASALTQAGGVVTPLQISPTMTRAEIIRLWQSKNAEKAILLSLYEWKADTAARTRLVYNAELEVLDDKGGVLASKQIQGEDNLGGSFWSLDPQANAQAEVPLALQKKLEELFADEITAALHQESRSTRPQ